MKGNYSESLFLNPVTEDEVKKIAMTQKYSSPGYDDISAEIVKYTCNGINQPLCHLMNSYFTTGIIPSEEFNIANITPIFKSNDPKLFTNYRPISVLPFFSKILEKLTHTRLSFSGQLHYITYYTLYLYIFW